MSISSQPFRWVDMLNSESKVTAEKISRLTENGCFAKGPSTPPAALRRDSCKLRGYEIIAKPSEPISANPKKETQMLDTCRTLLRVSPVLLLMLALCGASALLADQSDARPAEPNVETTTNESLAAPVADGMIVIRDAETGEVRQPTAEEMVDLQKSLKLRSPKQTRKTPTATQHRNGMLSMVLDESYFVMTVVEKNTDGEYQVVHHGKGSAPEQVESTELEVQ